MVHFHRTALANEFVAALRGEAALSDAHNGLFLAAPRRTGKSTFLQSDLKPALEAAGVVVAYVDLWANTQQEPGTLIADAIGRSLEAHQSTVVRVAKAAGMDNLSIGTPGAALKFDLTRIGKSDGITLSAALRALHEAARKPVALIVDEAQQAITSDAGVAAMTALKSARDQMNSPGKVNLMLVMSGSDRDKLLRLVNTKQSPFYGSQISSMPTLGRDFIAHIAQVIDSQRKTPMPPVDTEALTLAFEIFGHRPQFFTTALEKAFSPLTDLQGKSFEKAVLDAARQQQVDDESQMESEYLALKPLEQAVLWRLLEKGPEFRPYDTQALRFYSDKSGSATTPSQAQTALDSLRERSPSLVWKSERGEYAVEDTSMHRWYENRSKAGNWPPHLAAASAAPAAPPGLSRAADAA